MAFNFPTAPHVRIRGLVDDPNFVIRDNNGNDTGVRADVDLTVNGLVKNETVNVSPFVGYVANHSERWFTQGFGQIDIAMNESDGELQLEADVFASSVFPCRFRRSMKRIGSRSKRCCGSTGVSAIGCCKTRRRPT
jgi:hypothetical protein